MTSVLIVDDEPLARQRLQRMLRGEPDLKLLLPCADGRAAVAAIHEQRPDLMFLDVQMPGMTGFEVLAAVGPKQMLKPVGAERMHKALARARDFLAGGARRRLERQYAGLLRATDSHDGNCVLVKKRERVIVLRPEEIDFVEAYGDYVRLRVGQESHLLRGTLTDMEHRLKAAGFVRIHRSRLVNWQRVREFTADREHDPVVILKSGMRLDASAAYLKVLQRRLHAED